MDEVLGRLFGTDGVRGVANTELTCEMAMNIGRVAALVLTRHTSHKPKIVIGKDTRISSDVLEAALISGLCSVGADVLRLGVIATPGVAYLVKKYGADAGVMISASHNPVQDNGIKLFDGEGYKLPDEMEDELEALMQEDLTPYLKSGVELGRVSVAKRAPQDYIKHLMDSIDDNLEGIQVAVDCANGSASVTAEKLLRGLGASPLMINHQPDGTNINDRCGSTHMEALQEFMKRHKCQLGVAFDGDADRCLALDENGDLIDGDKMIAILAKDRKEKDNLPQNMAVVTVMSNLGFFRFAKEEGISTCTTKVGDRYILDEMRKSGYGLGGEQSGHIIHGDAATTGDGQLTAIRLMSVMKEQGKKLSALASVMERYPQVLLGIRADAQGMEKYENSEAVAQIIKDVETELGDDGRVLVRASGTEPLVRVMIEGKDFDKINDYALRIADVIKEQIAQK